MRIWLRTSPVVALATVGVLSATVLSGCSTAREAPPQQTANAQDIPRTSEGKPDFTACGRARASDIQVKTPTTRR
jgi:hypothetical protein